LFQQPQTTARMHFQIYVLPHSRCMYQFTYPPEIHVAQTFKRGIHEAYETPQVCPALPCLMHGQLDYQCHKSLCRIQYLTNAFHEQYLMCFIQKYSRRYVHNSMFQSLLPRLYAMLNIILTFHSIDTDQGKLKNIFMSGTE
jgi:hypothetical protein